MSEATPIRLPHENVNDEILKLVSWQVKEGQEVQEGQLLAEVETSKALVELIAPHSGKVWIQVQAGRDVEVGAVVAYITTNGSAPPLNTTKNQASLPSSGNGSRSGSPAAVSPLPEGTIFSNKALELIEKNGIAKDVFAGRGMIREQDVKKYLDELYVATSIETSEPLHFALKGIPLDSVTLPRLFSDDKNGFVDPQFLEELNARPDEFAELSSTQKCNLYRQHGAFVGEGAVLERGTIVIAPQIIIGEEARFAENSFIRCRERFCAGRLTSFRRNLSVTGGVVVFGENIHGGKDVQIGGGGNADPWSLLCIGDDSFVGDDVFINICRPVLIGKEVFLTQRSILVTHNIGHSVLEGYENRFAPVVLGDFAQIGMNTTVYPGSTVGRSAIVTSNSYVISSIPDGKLAMGVPARLVRDSRRQPDRARQLRIVQAMIHDFRELLGLKGLEVSPLESPPWTGFRVNQREKTFQLAFAEQFPASGASPEPADETVIWTFECPADSNTQGITLMNLLSKQLTGAPGIFSDSTREFLRKRGVRLKPGPWRYRRGLI